MSVSLVRFDHPSEDVSLPGLTTIKLIEFSHNTAIENPDAYCNSDSKLAYARRSKYYLLHTNIHLCAEHVREGYVLCGLCATLLCILLSSFVAHKT